MLNPDAMYEPIKNELNDVFKKILDVSSKYDKDEKNQQVFEQLSHVLTVPGKRIRPSITLLVSNLWNKPDSEKAILMATGVELLHIATLVHDDTVDHANLRRGHKTASSLWGRNAAVLIGDYIFSTSAIFVCETNNVRLIKRFAETITELSRGELNEINDSWKANISEDKYYERIYDKTASLFCTATESGALLGNIDEENVNYLKNFGYFLGMAYQIIDDLLDYKYSTDDIGKPANNDLKEGIMTLPAIYAYENGLEKEIDKYMKSSAENRLILLPNVIDKIRNSGGIEYSEQKAKDLIDNAFKILNKLPNSSHKISLEMIVNYIGSRKK
ncbi:MAG: polyprenyl synthetase family protein [Dehalococcoidia bacterium]